MTRRKINKEEVFAELIEVLNKVHQQDLKISWSSIAKVSGFTEQRARAKFQDFSEFIKSQKSNQLWDEANQAGSAKGFTPSMDESIANTSQEIHWQCSKGHDFTSSIRKMKYSNVACPHCLHGNRKHN